MLPFPLDMNGKTRFQQGRAVQEEQKFPVFSLRSGNLTHGDGFTADCQHSHASPDRPGTSSGRAVRPNLSQNVARFWRLRFSFERQRRFCVVIAHALTRESLGRHLGVNILSDGRGAAPGLPPNALLHPLESQEFALFGPAGWKFEGQTHEALCTELRRVFAVDDRRDDIGR
jgi:hypothetical protein